VEEARAAYGIGRTVAGCFRIGARPRRRGKKSVAREELGVPLRRLPAQWQLPQVPESIPGAAGPDSMSDRDPVEFDWARETARQIGTVAHRLLRQLAGEGIERWDGQRIASERKRVTRELAALGLTGSEVSAAVEEVLSRSQRPSPTHADAGCSTPATPMPSANMRLRGVHDEKFCPSRARPDFRRFAKASADCRFQVIAPRRR